jgi:UDP:flavonoid glycosyltransferase YjiC (YdhE family)
VARIVITTWGSYGDLYPYIGLGLELRRRGHRPVLAMPPIYRELVERDGLEFAAVRPDIDINDRETAARAMDPSHGPQVVFRELLIPHLADSHSDLMRATEHADLLVTHPAVPAAPIVAEERRMRWASSVLAPMSFFSAFDPPTPPPAPWMQPILASSLTLSRVFLWLTDRITQKWATPIRQFRASRGLKPGANPILAGQHSPSLVLAMFSKVLATPQPDWPTNVHVTGASMYNAEQQMAPNLSAFLDGGPPPIVFTLGTSAIATAGRFYEVSAQVIERLELRAVLLVGHHPQNRPSQVTERVFVAEFAPHSTLFARAAAVVHQCGAGTLHQALAHARPMIVVPHSHDQPDNARRATELGVARTLYPFRYTAQALERELTTVLTSGFARRAASVAEAVREENGARAASDAIERLLR